MLPVCIGIIMDGNRRWAKERGLPSFEGHRAGKEKLKEVMGWVREANISHLIVYVFSTENWNRAQDEVSYLMELLRRVFEDELEELKAKELRIRFVGDRNRLSEGLAEVLENVEKETAQFRNGALWVALSYGGRSEIVHAINGLIQSGAEAPVSEERFTAELWTSGMPDPDIIIRTGGDRRLSNFLPWQSVYSELFFEDMYWPDFSKEDFTRILREFDERERRKGK